MWGKQAVQVLSADQRQKRSWASSTARTHLSAQLDAAGSAPTKNELPVDGRAPALPLGPDETQGVACAAEGPAGVVAWLTDLLSRASAQGAGG